MKDFIKATGELHVVLRDQYGNIKEERHVPNLVVTAGTTLLASRLVGTASAAVSTTTGYMAVGTVNTAPAAGNTTLASEVAASRTLLTTASNAANVLTFATTFGAGVGTGALVEAGIFNANTGGSMLCRTVFGTVTKGATDSLTVNWTVTIN